MGGLATRADGGSATSQAGDLEGVRWAARPWLARGIRVVMLATPLVASVLVTRAYASAIDRPSTFAAATLYWLGMLAIATGVVVVVERWTRTLLPLAALFRLSLVFPDRAPSRFRMSLRRGTTTTLRSRLANGELDRADAAEALLAMIAELGSHDRLTRGHSERVRAYADMIGEELGLTPSDRDRLQWAALIHDVGKLTVPAEVLTKPDRPTETEWEILRRHPAAADPLVAPLRDWLGDWVLAATEHHERWDGRGYPRGLSGEQISLAGRIVAVADAYDTMTSVRSYKPGLAPELAREELTRNAGSQFDPAVVRAFLGVGLGRLRVALGPVAWLNEVVWIARIPHGVTAAGGVVAGATMAVATTLVAPAETAIGEPVAIERAVSDIVPDDSASPSDARATLAPASRETPTTITTTVAVATSTTTTTPPATTPAAASVERDEAPASTFVAPAAGQSTSSTTASAPPPPPVPTTTTTAAPVWIASLTLGGGLDRSQPLLDLDGTAVGDGVPNLDTDRDDDPGLTIERGHGLSERDPRKMQRWWVPITDTVALPGDARLEIWVAARDFDPSRTGRFVVGLHGCDGNAAGCALLGSTAVAFDQAEFGGDFGRVSATVPVIDATLVAGQSFVMTIATDNDSEDELWFAYGTVDHPASLRLG